jgi:hypothetical protein
MITRLFLTGYFFVAAVAVAEEAPPQAVEPPAAARSDAKKRVISSTKQFVVDGGEAADRGATVMLAEEAKTELLRLTEDTAETSDAAKGPQGDWWKVPVSITLHGKQGDPMPRRTIATRILIRDTGYEVHLDVHLSRGIESERFKHAVTGALIYARGLRQRPSNDDEIPFFVPSWLIDGLREATAWQEKRSDRRLYEALFRSGGLFKLDDLFSLDDRGFDEMDGAMRAAFHVSSGALVMALLEQPQGKAGFRAFLTGVAAFQGEMPALLRTHFPELNLSENSLAKWWQLQLANIGGQGLSTDVFTVARTEKALDEALRLDFRDQEGIIRQKEFTAWPELAALPEAERAIAVQLAQESLVRLSYRCFPSYRPILSEYQIVLGNLGKNQTDKVAESLTSLGERRRIMTAKSERARDFLDWFEITRARETSGAFDDYMRLKAGLKANPHRRTDEISKYLDRMDAIFIRGLDEDQLQMDPEPMLNDPMSMSLPELPPLPMR